MSLQWVTTGNSLLKTFIPKSEKLKGKIVSLLPLLYVAENSLYTYINGVPKCSCLSITSDFFAGKIFSYNQFPNVGLL